MNQSSNKTKRSFGTEAIKTTVSIVVLALGGGIFALLISMRQPPPDQDSDALVPLVKTYEAQPYTDTIDMLISGTVVPANEIKMTAEVNGRVLTKYPECEAGNYVTAGTKLIELDQEDLKLQLKSNEADLKQSQKMVAETEEDIKGATRNIELAQQELALLRSEHERNLRLRAQGAASDAEIDQSARALNGSQSQLSTRENALNSAKARLERMKAAIEVSEAKINQTKLACTKTTITAPTNGVIVQEMIQEGETAMTGTHLLTFEDTETVEVLCTLTARDLAWIRENNRQKTTGMKPAERISSIYRIPKTKVSVYDSRHPDVKWAGTLERVAGIGRDDKTKTIPVRIVIAKPIIETPEGPRALVRNMYVKCQIKVEIDEPDPKKQPLAFPATGLRPGNFVWLVEPNKTLKRKKVELLDQTRNDQGDLMAVIRGGQNTVHNGEKVVISPLSQATDGATVRLLEDEELSDDESGPKKVQSDSKASTDKETAQSKSPKIP
jgi:multidrug efflux pump subunit AcrA (membrane-fusion protein)